MIELLVVIAIIALLSSIVLAALNTARLKARDARRISDIHQIATAIKLYENDNNGQCPSTVDINNNSGDFIDSSQTDLWSQLSTILAPYIQLPSDPTNNGRLTDNAGNYSYGFFCDPTDGTNDYDLFAKLEDQNSPYISQIKHWVIHSSFYGSYGAYHWGCPDLCFNGLQYVYADH